MFLKAGVAVTLVLVAGIPSGSMGRNEVVVQRPIERAAERIAETERLHHAWLNLDLARAREQDALVAKAPVGSPLHQLDGMVVAVKDNLDTDWLPTTAGSRALRNRRPSRNATVVDRVLEAGGVIPGKTNMDTFARGVRTLSELGGQTRNAVDPTKSPGGSSGGTAVAVALGNTDVGIGTDTCGSLRYPAAYNGIYGLRPTPGLVSRSGLIPLSATHDVVGPMARTPRDLARLLDVIAGPDNRDPLTTAAPRPSRSYADILPAVRLLRIGVLRDRGAYITNSEGLSALTLLRAAGLELVDVKLPPLSLPNVINEEFRVLKPKLLSKMLVESDWIVGVEIDSRAYQQKQAQMRSDSQRVIAFMDASGLDAVVYPTTPYKASDLGEAQSSANCSLSSSTGTPALALPHPSAPTPGIDVLARPFSEALLIEIATRYAVVKLREQ